jgi:hypothetical protein
VRDMDGNVLSSWGGSDPCAEGNFSSPHGMWLDSRGDIYVGEVTGEDGLQKFVRQ